MSQSEETPPQAPEVANPPGPDWLYRWRQRVAGDSRVRQLVWRIVATALGVAIVAAGIVMLPLPGPGWAVIFLGLAVLATEYAWAHRTLVFAKDRAQYAWETAFSPRYRRFTWAVIVAAGLLLAAGAAWYVETNGWTLRPLLGWFGLG
jgi:uncharacterized protein (TIGR02611 family)